MSNDQFNNIETVLREDQPRIFAVATEGANGESILNLSTEVMEENGISIRNKRTKKLLPKMIKNADFVISMVEKPFIPDFLLRNKKIIRWLKKDVVVKATKENPKNNR